jgi:hypothetical protein
MMNLREKEDAWAAAFGGFMCGSVLGLPCKDSSPQFYMAFGYGGC